MADDRPARPARALAGLLSLAALVSCVSCAADTAGRAALAGHDRRALGDPVVSAAQHPGAPAAGPGAAAARDAAAPAAGTGAPASSPAPSGAGAGAAGGTRASGTTATAPSSASAAAGGADPVGAGAAPATPAGSWQRSLWVAMPADLTAAPDRCAGSGAARGTGWVAAENRKPGVPGFSAAALPRTGVLGYLDRQSVACGQTVSVHLSGRGSVGGGTVGSDPASSGATAGTDAGADDAVRLTAYRIGWYDGAGARRVWTSEALHVQPRRTPAPVGAARLVEPRWPVTTAVSVDATWAPGTYLLVPERGGHPAGPGIPLVVRDDRGSEPVLMMQSTMTWAAYDDFAGQSLYHGRNGVLQSALEARSRIVTLRRPLVGAGYRQMLSMDLPLVSFLESLGLDIAYTTDVELDQRPSELRSHAELVTGGHSEYWTGRLFAAVEAARNAGLNIAFLGANSVFWQARLEPAPGDREPSRVAVWRDLNDPVARTAPELATLHWTANALGRDRASLLGQAYAAIKVHGGMQVLSAPAWMLVGTGLRTGSVLAASVGNEADGYVPRTPVSPMLQVVAAGVLHGNRKPVVVASTYYTTPSGAAVFAAGTTDWVCVLDGGCRDLLPPAATVTAVRRLTENVVRTLAHRGAGGRHPSVPLVTPDAATLAKRLPAGAIGTYGVDVPTGITSGDGDDD